jgi:hypothetical protein
MKTKMILDATGTVVKTDLVTVEPLNTTRVERIEVLNRLIKQIESKIAKVQAPKFRVGGNHWSNIQELLRDLKRMGKPTKAFKYANAKAKQQRDFNRANRKARG